MNRRNFIGGVAALLSGLAIWVSGCSAQGRVLPEPRLGDNPWGLKDQGDFWAATGQQYIAMARYVRLANPNLGDDIDAYPFELYYKRKIVCVVHS